MVHDSSRVRSSRPPGGQAALPGSLIGVSPVGAESRSRAGPRKAWAREGGSGESRLLQNAPR